MKKSPAEERQRRKPARNAKILSSLFFRLTTFFSFFRGDFLIKKKCCLDGENCLKTKPSEQKQKETGGREKGRAKRKKQKLKIELSSTHFRRKKCPQLSPASSLGVKSKCKPTSQVSEFDCLVKQRHLRQSRLHSPHPFVFVPVRLYTTSFSIRFCNLT